jgi:hypothetical protein
VRIPRSESLHEKIVDKLVEAGATRFRFKQHILDAVCGKHGSHEKKLSDANDPDSEYTECERCFVSEEMGNVPRPDAFRIDEEAQEIFVYEVEVTHRVTEGRVERYADLWWALDEEYWLLRLIVVDRFENHTEIDVLASDVQMRSGENVSDYEMWLLRAHMGIPKPDNPKAIRIARDSRGNR